MKRRVRKPPTKDIATTGQMRQIEEPIITDAQWEKLKDLSGLPDRARSHVEALIACYRRMRPYQGTNYPKLKQQLATARKWEQYSLRLLQNSIVADNIFLPLAHGPDWIVPLSPDQQLSERTHIEAVVKDKEWLIGFYDRSIRRITRGPRDKKTQNSLRFLVASLLYKLVDKHLSISEAKPVTKFILEVCKIAAPGIKPSTVQTFIKKIVHAHRAWETEGVDRMWVFITNDPDDIPIHLMPPIFPPPREDW